MKKQKRTWDGVCGIQLESTGQKIDDRILYGSCYLDVLFEDIDGCGFADKLRKQGKTKHDCPYWHEWPKED